METKPTMMTLSDVHYQTVSTPNIVWYLPDCNLYPITGKVPGRSKSRKRYVKTHTRNAIEFKQSMSTKRG